MSTLELDVGDLKPRAVEFTATELATLGVGRIARALAMLRMKALEVPGRKHDSFAA